MSSHYQRRCKWLARFDIVSSAPYSISAVCRTPSPPTRSTLVVQTPLRTRYNTIATQNVYILYYGIMGCIKIDNCSSVATVQIVLPPPTCHSRAFFEVMVFACIVYIIHFALYRGSSIAAVTTTAAFSIHPKRRVDKPPPPPPQKVVLIIIIIIIQTHAHKTPSYLFKRTTNNKTINTSKSCCTNELVL